jgi:A/G-specific adenine glycosylase
MFLFSGGVDSFRNLTLRAMSSFSKTLISWYGKNKRDLPWRHTKDPYLVWLSEVILQQTRIEQGLAYYLKFEELFPNVHQLGNASAEQVLKAWQGLGYYSRARNLHATARMISTELNGVFPTNKAELLRLKGIGDYTASAIASFCYGEKAPVIDGNVIRFLSRLSALEYPADTTDGKKAVLKLAEELIDRDDPGTYNQAIMEFGSQHCTPKNPGCDLCPFSSSCKALLQNQVDLFPVKKKKIAVREMVMHYFVLKTKNGLYMRRRGDESIWKGLYDFPSIEEQCTVDEAMALFASDFQLPDSLVLTGVSEEYTHILTHRKIKARFYEINLKQKLSQPHHGWLFVDYGHIRQYPLPRLIDRYFEQGGIYGRKSS